MKKLIAIAIAVLTVFSFTTVAFAESTTTLTTTVPDAEYTLNIPADQEIPYGATSTEIGNVTVTDSKYFAVGKNVRVEVEWTDFASEEATTTIPFALHSFGVNANSEVVLESNATPLVFKGLTTGIVKEKADVVSDGAVHPVEKLSVVINSTDWGKALAGDYTATITFTAEVVAE